VLDNSNSGVLEIDDKVVNTIERYKGLMKFILTVIEVTLNVKKLLSLKNSPCPFQLFCFP
jgi:hypothetical protein